MVPEHTEVTVRIPVHTSEDCRAVSSVLARVGDKWSVLIIVLLGNGSKRFNEIKRSSAASHRGYSRSHFEDWSGMAWSSERNSPPFRRASFTS